VRLLAETLAQGGVEAIRNWLQAHFMAAGINLRQSENRRHRSGIGSNLA
jgi:hypothetical protein